MLTLKRLLPFTLILLMLAATASAGGFKINRMQDIHVGGYDCNGTLELNDAQFGNITAYLNSSTEYSEIPKYYEPWDASSRFGSSTDLFNRAVRLNGSEISIYLTKQYWMVVYDLNVSGSSDVHQAYSDKLNLLQGKFSVGDFVRHAVLREGGCYNGGYNDNLFLIIYNFYDYDANVSCLVKPNTPPSTCEGNMDYEKLTTAFDFTSPIDENRLHFWGYDNIIRILDKKHLGNSFTGGLGREIVLSHRKISSYGSFSNIVDKDYRQYVLNLRQIRSHIENLTIRKDQLDAQVRESDKALSELRDSILDWKNFDVFTLRSKFKNLTVNVDNAKAAVSDDAAFVRSLSLESTKPTAFYVGYYSNIATNLISNIESLNQEYESELTTYQQRVDGAWEAAAQVMQIRVALIIGVPVAILVTILNVWLSNRKKSKTSILILKEKCG